MDNANMSSSTIPSSSMIASPSVSVDPSYVDIEVDVEVPAVVQSPELEQVPSVASETVSSLASEDSFDPESPHSLSVHASSHLSLPSLDDESPHSLSVHASSHLSLPAGEGFLQHVVNWRRLITAIGIATTITILIVLIMVVVIPRRTRKMHECKISFLVSKDGLSDFRTVSEAVEASRPNSPFKVCILIREGEYEETVKIGPDKTNLVLIGEGIEKTKITSNASFYSANGAWQAATLWVNGKRFMARDLTISNTAKFGVAVDNWADKSVFFRCNFKGTNMTLNAKGGKQFYRNCHVYGKTYLVTGDAFAFFQRCEFFSEKSYDNEKIVFSGQSRRLLSYKAGFIFHHCTFNTVGNSSSQKVFLGSALGDAALIVVIQCYLDASITGYVIDIVNTTYFAIFGNTGPGATKSAVPPLVHVLGDEEAESEFSLRVFLNGYDWIPTEVEYDLDLDGVKLFKSIVKYE